MERIFGEESLKNKRFKDSFWTNCFIFRDKNLTEESTETSLEQNFEYFSIELRIFFVEHWSDLVEIELCWGYLIWKSEFQTEVKIRRKFLLKIEK